MMTLSSAEIMSWVGSFIWPLFRIAALVAAAPVFGARTIPASVKVIFAVVFTLIIAPISPPVPVVDPLSGEAVLIVMNQILIGGAMGLALQLVFAMFIVGGQIIAFQMGLGFASMVDPSSGTQVPVVSQFYVIVLPFVFLALDGHLTFISVMAESFHTLPIGVNGLSNAGLWALVNWGGNMYAGAVQIALPAIASLLLINWLSVSSPVLHPSLIFFLSVSGDYGGGIFHYADNAYGNSSTNKITGGQCLCVDAWPSRWFLKDDAPCLKVKQVRNAPRRRRKNAKRNRVIRARWSVQKN